MRCFAVETVLGIDEAGRGPVIGPLVMAGVLIDRDNEKKLRALGVKDSKLLTPAKRESLKNEIKKIAKDHIIVKISARRIDELRKSTNLNVIEAQTIAKIINSFEPDEAIIDSPQVSTEKFASIIKPLLKKKVKLVVENKADMNYPVCAAASILAKLERDREIKKIEEKFGIVVNTGYPHDPATISFLKSCKGKYPDFVRKSWSTASRLKRMRRNLKYFS